MPHRHWPRTCDNPSTRTHYTYTYTHAPFVIPRIYSFAMISFLLNYTQKFQLTTFSNCLVKHFSIFAKILVTIKFYKCSVQRHVISYRFVFVCCAVCWNSVCSPFRMHVTRNEFLKINMRERIPLFPLYNLRMYSQLCFVFFFHFRYLRA